MFGYTNTHRNELVFFFFITFVSVFGREEVKKKQTIPYFG